MSVEATKYQGKEELDEYVRKTTTPIFDDFVLDNNENMMSWCIKMINKEPHQIYNAWRNRFTLSLRTQRKLHTILKGKSAYNRPQWERFHIGAKALADSKINCTIHALDAAQKATQSAINILATSFGNCRENQDSTASSSTGQINSNLLVGGETSNTSFNDVENEDMSWTSMKDDVELKFHNIAHKKAESGCNAEEQKYLAEFKSDGTPRSDLYKLSAKLLLKDKLTFQEDALLTLSLSGIYNYFHPFTTAMYSGRSI